MADDQDKSQQTEEASPKRLEDARKKGQVPQSKEPSTALAFLVLASLAFTGLGSWILARMMDLMRDAFSGKLTMDADPQGFQEFWGHLTLEAALMVLPVAIPMMLVGMFVAFLVAGPVFTFETLQPKMDKVSPMKGLKRLFSTRSLSEFVKSILKLVVISIACWLVVEDLFPHALRSTRKDVESIGALMVEGTTQIAALVAFLFFFIAMADVLYQRWEHMKGLRMSKKEQRDEYKEAEGDPYLKSKIRQIQMEQAQNRMMADVPKADVVITNPTHIAVALKYEEGGFSAPKVLAKGKGEIAAKIREVARENDIPLRENKPLARSLFKSVEIGGEIPESLFEAVAIILAEVFRMKK